MKRIGLISDTHLYSPLEQLPEAVFSTFSSCQLILHAGDILCEEVLYSLDKIAPTLAVAGNNDPRSLVEKLGFQNEIRIANFKILLLHGHDGYGTAVQNVKRSAKKSKVDIVVFGHSHAPVYFTESGKHFINPGSAVQRRRQPKCSIAVLELTDEVRVEHIFF